MPYSPAHHFDRPPGKTHAEAFKDGAKYVQAEIDRAVKALKDGDIMGAIAAIGRGLHTVQDFFAHSNFVDLSEEDKELAKEALFDPSKEPPKSLMLTGYDPRAPDPYNPPGDPYPHGRGENMNAKDNDSHPKFEEAYKAAVEASKEFVRVIKKKLEEEVGKEKAAELWSKFKSFKGERFIFLLPPPYEKYPPAAVVGNCTSRLMFLWYGEYRNISAESEELDALLRDLSEYARAYSTGISAEYPFGLNLEHAESSLASLESEIRDAIARGDLETAEALSRSAIYYVDAVLRDAEKRGISTGEVEPLVAVLESLVEEGRYEEVVPTALEALEALLPEVYPEYQEVPRVSVYFVEVVHEGEPLEGTRVDIEWVDSGYGVALSTDSRGTAIAAGPSGRFRCYVPVRLNLLGLPIVDYAPQLRDKLVLASASGSISEAGVVKIRLEIRTILPLRASLFLAENVLNISVAILSVLIVYKLVRRFTTAPAYYG